MSSLVLGPGSYGKPVPGTPAPRVCLCSSSSAGGGLGGAGSRGAQWHGLWKAPAAVVHIDEVFKSFFIQIFMCWYFIVL